MPRKRTAEDSSGCDSDSDYNPEVKRQKTRPVNRKKKQKKTRVPTVKANIVLLAVNEATSKAVDSLKDIDQGVLTRIKKALALGSHEHTGEEEAKQAMRIAFRLMAQHNVSQADILASEEEPEKLKRAGQSCVEIRSTKDKTLRCYNWMDDVSSAVEALFDCRSYTAGHEDRIVWTFYGLCESTVAAAYSFEMVFNLIMEWSESKKWKLIYRSGVGEGLLEFACNEKDEEVLRVQSKELARVEKAIAEEEEEDRRRLARLEDPPAKETEKVNASLKKTITVENVLDEDDDPNPPTTFTIYDYGPVKQDDEEDEGGDGCDPDEEGRHADFQIHNEHEVIDVDAIDQILQDIEVKKSANIEVKREEETAKIPGACEAKEKENKTKRNESKTKKKKIKAKEKKSEVKEKESKAKLKESKGKEKESEEKERQVEEEQTPWSSKQQLILFRENANKLAEDWLTENKIKLGAPRRNRFPKLKTDDQWEAFSQGLDDAKKIDLKRNKIKEFGEE